MLIFKPLINRNIDPQNSTSILAASLQPFSAASTVAFDSVIMERVLASLLCLWICTERGGETGCRGSLPLLVGGSIGGGGGLNHCPEIR